MGVVTISQPILVLIEFMENGDLENFLRKRRQGVINSVVGFTVRLLDFLKDQET